METLTVKTFGNFSVEGMGTVLNEDKIHSKMLTKLFSYILCHHQQEITSQELTDILWSEESSVNPIGALKNLMYRLRVMLKKTWGDYNYIITGHGCYQWNNEIALNIDADRFDSGCHEASLESDEFAQIKQYEEALSLYTGPFLPDLGTEYWVVALSTYYHSTYLTAVKHLLSLLEKNAMYEQMADWCSIALTFDSLDEELHTSMIKALIAQHKIRMARAHYKEAETMLYDNLGIAPSKELRGIYEELLKKTNDRETDLSKIENELREENNEGSFLCDYGVFKRIYHLEMRRSGRLGIPVFILLITLEPIANLPIGSEVYLETIKEGMNRMEKVLLNYLRAGDVISRYSGSQFIVLLPTCRSDTIKRVIMRIHEQFYKGKKQPKIKVDFQSEEMTDERYTSSYDVEKPKNEQ